jgi:hypothetical protein
LLLLVAAPGCLGPLDTMGNETLVTEDESLNKDPKLEDDRIEDKKPVFDPALKVTEDFDGCQVILNKSGSVTKLDIAEFGDSDGELADALFPDRRRAMEAVSRVGNAELLPSMEVVNGFMKPFNDGLYAAIEVAVQQGDGVVGKRKFLSSLLARLSEKLSTASAAQRAHIENAVVFVAAGLTLGGKSPADLSAQLLAKAKQDADAFRAGSPVYSRPIGFYSWNKTLEGVFTQDRYLQNQGQRTFVKPEDQLGMFAAMAAVIEEDPALAADYQSLLALYAGLTNPYASYTPADLYAHVDGLASLDDVAAVEKQFKAKNPDMPYVCTGNYMALLPASRGKDVDYFKGAFCGTPPGPEVDFMNVLIDAIRGGKLDVAPDKSSGWYDYQLHALETLLLPERGPESDHLLLTAAYKKKLIETFKSILTQNRETHVKQLEMGTDAVSFTKEIEIYPKFPVEPFPTFYLRTARAYRFLGTYLQGVLGADFFKTHPRLREGGEKSDTSLEEELRGMTGLLYGLHALTARSVGLDPKKQLLADELAEFPMEANVTRARSWVRDWRGDPDILADPRVIVPVWNSTTTKSLVYWAILGVKVIKISTEFVEGHEPEVVGADGGCIVKGFTGRSYYLLMEQMEQVRTPAAAPPPTRQEWRKICDEHKTRDAIVEAMSKLGGK